MPTLRNALLALSAVASATAPARANCQFSPFSFFPDRNDAVEVKVVTEAGHGCTMAFREGPGYRFTGASFLRSPPHGVLAKTGPAAFLYLPLDGYKGPDSYGIKLCANVQGRRGCSSLTYRVDVR